MKVLIRAWIIQNALCSRVLVHTHDRLLCLPPSPGWFTTWTLQCWLGSPAPSCCSAWPTTWCPPSHPESLALISGECLRIKVMLGIKWVFHQTVKHVYFSPIKCALLFWISRSFSQSFAKSSSIQANLSRFSSFRTKTLLQALSMHDFGWHCWPEK